MVTPIAKVTPPLCWQSLLPEQLKVTVCRPELSEMKGGFHSWNTPTEVDEEETGMLTSFGQPVITGGLLSVTLQYDIVKPYMCLQNKMQTVFRME